MNAERQLKDLGNELDGESTGARRTFYRGLWDAAKNVGRYSLLAGALAIGSLGGCKGDEQPHKQDIYKSPVVNQAPVVQPIPDQTVLEGEELVLDLGSYISDPEGDPLTVELVSRQGTVSGDRFSYQDAFDADHDDDVYTMEFLVKDDNGNQTPGSFRLAQKDANRLPVIKAIQDQILPEGAAIDLDLSPYISDEDRDSLIAELLSSPGTISSNRFRYQDIFDADHANDAYVVEFKVKDGYGGERKSSFRLTQQDINRSPIVQSIPDQDVQEGGSTDLDLSPYISDPENDSLTARVTNGPGSITNNRYIHNDPVDADHDNGVYTVEFLVKDSRGGQTRRSFKLTQQDVNQAPAIQLVPDQDVQEGDQADLDLSSYISDPENDSLTARVVSGPGSIANSRYSHNNSFDSNHDDDVYTVEILIEDGHGGQARRSFKLNQQDVNQTPIIKRVLSDLEIIEGESLNRDIDVDLLGNFPQSRIYDPERDSLTIRILSGPGRLGGTGPGGYPLRNDSYTYEDEMDIDSTDDVHTIEFLVEDGYGGQVIDTFKITQKDFTLPSPIKNTQMREGVVLTSWWHNDYSQPHIDATLQYLYDLGVEDVSVLTTWYQNNTNSLDIERDSFKTPNDYGIERVLKLARFKYGMRTTLKPHVDLWDNSWRGNISHTLDADWTQWFEEYTDFITHYAELAERNQVDCLVIGTELKGTVHRPEWRQVIQDVRAVYPEEVLYSAHWDSYKNVPFWDDLDGVGIGVYFPENEFATRAQEARDFAASLGKELYVLEVGCQNRVWGGQTPWWSNGMRDDQEQADYYQTVFDNLFNKPNVAVMSIWEVYHNLTNPDGFTFIFKPAEQVVRDHYDR